MSRLHSALSRWRDYLTPAIHTSTFTATGQLTPEEFVATGDYLCYKFPTWSWEAGDPSKRVSYLPDDKQYLVLQHAPCHTRLDDTFSTWNPGDDDDLDEEGGGGESSDGGAAGFADQQRVKTVTESGDVEEDEQDSDDEIPDMDDEEDDEEAIIRDSSKRSGNKGVEAPLRYYNLYLTYSTFYRVPRSYISGLDGATRTPLHPPTVMFEDISPDYREKTVTIESFPCLDAPLQMATVHPCRHAETMKRIFDGMQRRKSRRNNDDSDNAAKALEQEGGTGDDWEQVAAATAEAEEAEEGGLRVDQYLVVFVKFLAGVLPGVELDYTMGI